MIAKLLTEHHLEFLGLKGGCRGSSESTLVKMTNCWKSHAAANLSFVISMIFMSAGPNNVCCLSVAGAIDTRYSCCSGDLAAEGCQVSKVLYEFLLTVKAVRHECVIRTGQP